MAKFKEITVTLDIKGRSWTFILMSDAKFDKINNPEGEAHTAMTVQRQYEVHFKKSEWTVIDIRHEIGHILYYMNQTDTADLKPDDVEEVMCQIIGHNAPEIVTWADRVAEKFFGRE